MLRNKSWFDDLYAEDNASKCKCASIPLYKDWIYSVMNLVHSNKSQLVSFND